LGVRTAEAGTDETNIYITNNYLSPGDFIVNQTRRTNYSEERGSRLVSENNTLNSFEIVGNGIAGMTDGDQIALFAYVLFSGGSLFVNSKLKAQTLRVTCGVEGKNSARFTLIITPDQDAPLAGIPIEGQYVQILDGYRVLQFYGFIKSRRLRRPTENSSVIEVDIDCDNINAIAARRTVSVNFEVPEVTPLYMGDVVTSCVNRYLIQEGITLGDIRHGLQLQDDWIADVVSIADICNQAAAASGFQWYVDTLGQLNFHQNPADIPDAEYDIVDGGDFTDFKNVEVSGSVDGYANKCFFVGGNDSQGNVILISSDNNTEVNNKQDFQGGTGVYGCIIRDSSITNSDYEVADSGTSGDNINIASHGQEVGWVIWNITANVYGFVTAIVDDNNFTVTMVSDLPVSNSAGDTIVFFNGVNQIVTNELDKRSTFPQKVSFDTDTPSFNAGEKMTITLGIFAVNGTFLIEEVEYFDLDGLHIRQTVRTVRRDPDNFNTQKSINYYDDFGNF
jgi:hypothetical protein